MDNDKAIDTVVKTTEFDPVVSFSKPYTFEEETYTKVELKHLEDLTSTDMVEAEKFLLSAGIVSPLPEMTTEYVIFIANRASDQPMEFFRNLPPKDMIKVKNKITNFFYGKD